MKGLFYMCSAAFFFGIVLIMLAYLFEEEPTKVTFVWTCLMGAGALITK